MHTYIQRVLCFNCSFDHEIESDLLKLLSRPFPGVIKSYQLRNLKPFVPQAASFRNTVKKAFK